MTAKIIYLIESIDGIIWCDDTALSEGQIPESATKYVRSDIVDKLMLHAYECCPDGLVTELQDLFSKIDMEL